MPYVGFGLGLVLGVLAALLQWHGLPGFVAVLVVYGVGQLLEGYVLVPWLVGDRIGLHPVAVIFALLAFGEVFGFAGVLLALAGERGAAGRSASSAQSVQRVCALPVVFLGGPSTAPSANGPRLH